MYYDLTGFQKKQFSYLVDVLQNKIICEVEREVSKWVGPGYIRVWVPPNTTLDTTVTPE